MRNSFCLGIPDLVQLQAQRTNPRAFLFGDEQELSSALCAPTQQVLATSRRSGWHHNPLCSERLTEDEEKCSVCQPGAPAACHSHGRNTSERIQQPEFLLATPRQILGVGEIISVPLRQPPHSWRGKKALGKKGNRMCLGCHVIAATPLEMWSLCQAALGRGQKAARLEGEQALIILQCLVLLLGVPGQRKAKGPP